MKALLYFEVVSTLAVGVGLIVGHVLHPGAGFNISLEWLGAGKSVFGLVIPTGYNVNLDGAALHMALATPVMGAPSVSDPGV